MVTPILKSHDGDKKTARTLASFQTPAVPDKPPAEEPGPKETPAAVTSRSATPDEKKSPAPPHPGTEPPRPASAATSKAPAQANPEPVAPPGAMINQFERVKALAQMAEAIANGIERFLVTFKYTINPEGTLRGLSRVEFFQKYVAQAAQLSVKPSKELAAIFRSHSSQADVRVADLDALAKAIRDSCFAELDGLLLNSVALLEGAGIDLSGSLDVFRDSPLPKAAPKVLANPPPPEASPDPSRDPDGAPIAFGPFGSAPEIVPPPKNQGQTKSQGQALALLKMVDYLRALKRLPAALLDYGSAQCFGGDADAGLHKKVLLNIQGLIEPKLNESIELILSVASVETRELERLKEAQLTRVNAGQELKARKAWREAQGIGFLAFSGICLFPGWVAVLSGSLTGTLKALVIFTGIIGCFSFFWGITQMTFSRGTREEDLELDAKLEANLSRPPDASSKGSSGQSQSQRESVP